MANNIYDEVLEALRAQEERSLLLLNGLNALTEAVTRLCEALKPEDEDPEDLPIVSLDGEVGGRPREAGQDLG